MLCALQGDPPVHVLQEAEHYQDNTALKRDGPAHEGSGGNDASAPLYYNGRVPAYCVVKVEGEGGGGGVSGVAPAWFRLL